MIPAAKSRWARRAVRLGLASFAAALLAAEAPPAFAPLEEKKWDALSQRETGRRGAEALAFKPERWLHGESGHFILHYRRVTEARRVAPEIEYYLWWVARALGATPDRYARKSHVFIFEDEKEWTEFKAQAGLTPWASSIAIGDELYLSIREAQTGLFHSKTLAHETVHAVVARLYPGRRWPKWLNEGYAESAGKASAAARMGQWPGNPPTRLPQGDYPLDELLRAKPGADADTVSVHRFYRSSERLVRFILAEIGPERLPAFVDRLLDDGDFGAALVATAPEKYPSYPAFLARWERWKSLNP